MSFRRSLLKAVIRFALIGVLLIGSAISPVTAQDVGDCYTASQGCFSQGCGPDFWQPWTDQYAYIYHYCWDGSQWVLSGGRQPGCCWNA